MGKLLAGRHVLVVEDEMLVLMNTEDMLADLGCEHISAAATIDQALEMIDTQSFDAAMLDMNLNGDRTDRVADALADHGVPFMFATGYGGRELRVRDRDRPMLRKPFPPHELVSILLGLFGTQQLAVIGGAPS